MNGQNTVRLWRRSQSLNYATVLGKYMADSGSAARECPFCDVSRMEALVYNDDTCYAAISRRPINKYHILVIPRQHYESFVALPDEIACHIFLVAKRLSTAIRKVCNPDAITHASDDDVTGRGFNLVSHYKLHIIPRYASDKVRVSWHRERDPGPKRRSKYAAEIKTALMAGHS